MGRAQWVARPRGARVPRKSVGGAGTRKGGPGGICNRAPTPPLNACFQRGHSGPGEGASRRMGSGGVVFGMKYVAKKTSVSVPLFLARWT